MEKINNLDFFEVNNQDFQGPVTQEVIWGELCKRKILLISVSCNRKEIIFQTFFDNNFLTRDPSNQSLANVDQKWRIERDNRYGFLVWTHAQNILEYVTAIPVIIISEATNRVDQLSSWPNCAIVILIFSLSGIPKRFLISLTQILLICLYLSLSFLRTRFPIMYEAIRKIPSVEPIRSYARFRQTLIIGSLFLMNNDY